MQTQPIIVMRTGHREWEKPLDIFIPLQNGRIRHGEPTIWIPSLTVDPLREIRRTISPCVSAYTPIDSQQLMRNERGEFPFLNLDRRDMVIDFLYGLWNAYGSVACLDNRKGIKKYSRLSKDWAVDEQSYVTRKEFRGIKRPVKSEYYLLGWSIGWMRNDKLWQRYAQEIRLTKGTPAEKLAILRNAGTELQFMGTSATPVPLRSL